MRGKQKQAEKFFFLLFCWIKVCAQFLTYTNTHTHTTSFIHVIKIGKTLLYFGSIVIVLVFVSFSVRWFDGSILTANHYIYMNSRIQMRQITTNWVLFIDVNIKADTYFEHLSAENTNKKISSKIEQEM